MKLIISHTINTVEVTVDKKTLLVYPFNLAIDKVPTSAFANKGDVLAGTGSGAYDNLPVGTDGYVLKADSAEAMGVKWALESAANICSQFWLGVRSGILPTTAPCGAAVQDTETTTNKHNSYYAPFDKDTEEHMEFEHALPSDYDGDVVYATFYWRHAAATAFYVVLGMEAVAIGNDEALDAAWGSPQTVTDTGGTTGDVYITSNTAAITIGGTPAAGKLARWRAFRKAADGADTLDVDAKLIGVMITYGRS